MTVINIMVAANTEQLEQQVKDRIIPAGDIYSPTDLDDYFSNVYIVMIAQQQIFVPNDDTSSKFTVKADAGDIIRWTITSFDGNTGYSTFFYDCNLKPSKYFSELEYLNFAPKKYLPDGIQKEPLHKYHNHVYAAQVSVLKSEETEQTIDYDISFQLLKNSDTGRVIGYFKWNALIIIS